MTKWLLVMLLWHHEPQSQEIALKSISKRYDTVTQCLYDIRTLVQTASVDRDELTGWMYCAEVKQ